MTTKSDFSTGNSILFIRNDVEQPSVSTSAIQDIIAKDIYKHPQSKLNTDEIKKLLPHRYPFLLVDRVTEISSDFIIGYKNLSNNEDFFNGHFPQKQIMPGVLQVEALAQIAGLFLLNSYPDMKSEFLFGGINGVRWRKPVVPGNSLIK